MQTAMQARGRTKNSLLGDIAVAADIDRYGRGSGSRLERVVIGIRWGGRGRGRLGRESIQIAPYDGI